MLRRFADRLDALPRAALPLTVAAVALVIRLWVLFEQRGANPLYTLAILDDRTYLDLAIGLRDGSASRPWFLAPLHPAVLALVSATPTMLTVSLVNLTAGVATSVAAAWTARALHSQAAGWVSGLLVAGGGTFVFHDTLPGQEPLLALLHVVGVLLVVRWLRTGALLDAGLLGVVAGVATMGRATSLALAAAALLLAATRLRPRATQLRGTGALVLGLALVLVPAALRNHRVAGDFTPLPWSGGVNLYMANGPDARELTAFGARELGMAPDAMAARATSIAEEAAGRDLRPSEVSSYWAARTGAESGGVGAMTAHVARKAGLFFAASEYGNNHYVELERRYAIWLRVVPVSGWWLLALGVGGWWLVRRRIPAADALALVITLTWAALTIVYPVSRYRLPVLPLAAILAGAGLVEALRTDDRRRRAIAAALIVAVTGVAHLDGVLRSPPAAAASYVNLATALAHEGRAAESEEILREATADWPDDGPAHLELGRALMQGGRFTDALVEFGKAESDTRTQWAAGVPALYALVESGQATKAEEVGRVLLANLPPEPAMRAEMLAWWALAARARGDLSTAKRRLDAARTLMPDHPAVAVATQVIAGR